MTVTQNESYFVDLARHALLLLTTEGEIVRRFIEGVTHPVRLQMAKETGSEISFQAAANVARRIEMVFAQDRGQRSDKRPRQFGSFSGTSSRGRGNPAFSAHSAPISELPLQSHYNGYLAHLGQLQLQQSQHQDRCYECGNIGHIRRYCPRLSTRPEADSSDDVIKGIIPVFHRDDSVLFDPGSTYSYVSSYFASYLVVPCDSLSASVCVSTPVEDCVVVDHVYTLCVVIIGTS
ncbi:uncharacterized protein [Nicotiana tomentosiformis]|uniref:uncharacterized protein n=1 Tax=Nicotiana tomentosiformis TaxID=4098 RepID=UPI00388CE571